MAEAERIKALGEASESLAPYPVNQPTIGTWLDAMGYDNDPRFTRGRGAAVDGAGLDDARPAAGTRGADDPLRRMMEMLTDAGYTAVLGTNCEQTYERYLRVGEQVSGDHARSTRSPARRTPRWARATSSPPRNIWHVGDEVVATMLFRVLKFMPARSAGHDRSKIIRPVVNRDSQFFWDGTRPGELRIQKCNACGALRHPPGPACPSCHAYRPRVRRRRRHRHGLLATSCTAHPPVPGQGAADRDRADRPRRGRADGGEVVDVADPEIEIGMPLRVDCRRGRRRADPADLEASMRTAGGRPAHPRVEPADDADARS